MSRSSHTMFLRLFQVLKTPEFISWHNKQPPKKKAIITARLDLLSIGHLGNHKRFEGLLELRWKNGQNSDIKKAKKIRDEVLEGTRSIQE